MKNEAGAERLLDWVLGCPRKVKTNSGGFDSRRGPRWKSAVPDGLAIDIGCGWAKRPGFIGVDKDAVPDVEHRVDVEREPLPFADRSVGTIFTPIASSTSPTRP
jgi:hypothetical protein